MMISKQSFLPIYNPMFLSLNGPPHTLRTLLLVSCVCVLTYFPRNFTAGQICMGRRTNSKGLTFIWVLSVNSFRTMGRLRGKELKNIRQPMGYEVQCQDWPQIQDKMIQELTGADAKVIHKVFSIFRNGPKSRKSCPWSIQLEVATKCWKEHILVQQEL